MRRGVALDWTIALLGTGLTEWVVLISPDVGNPVAGPRWLTASWPLLLDLPLAWRRRMPLASFLLVLAAIKMPRRSPQAIPPRGSKCSSRLAWGRTR